MTIEIYPEDEEIIKTKLARGDFSSPAQMIHRALAALFPAEKAQPAAPGPFLNRDRLKATPAERAAAFEGWARSHEYGIVLPEEAVQRESFYE
jgi:hypothetical protein